MPDSDMVPDELMRILRDRYGSALDRFLVPPPVFIAMGGEFVSFDAESELLEARFPVRREWLNPYGMMQGGMLAAAIDNTLGPLSMLVAPPNVTRRMEVKYSRAALPEMEYVLVEARCLERDGRWLRLQAVARSPKGELLARAKASHWILEDDLDAEGNS
ncbi:MAG: PaaI family thioesterase [Anaerolineales bacterium]